MKVEGQDRRSQRTRLALIQALAALLNRKPYDQIGINDVVEEANVGRSTFYAHFEDKDHLLRAGFEVMLDQLVDHIAPAEAAQSFFDVTMLFRHGQGHYNLYRALIWGPGMDVLTQHGHAALSAKMEQRLTALLKANTQPGVPLPLLAHSAAGSLLVLYKWWLENKMPYSPERMNEYFQRLVVPGIRAGLEE